MKKSYSVLVIMITVFMLSAQNEKPLFEKNGIKIFAHSKTPDFPEAELKLVTPAPNSVVKAGKDTFSFSVTNYTLGAQTPDADQVMCANSAKGQHIHFILDNQPYVASYSHKIPADVKEGSHVLLAFLSRSYHESIKHKKAYVLYPFEAGSKAATEVKFNAKAPHIFFSRPKGDYIGEKEVKRIMLDFYLVNCTLSDKGYKVRATINGTEFMFSKWEPYIIEGLPLGANKIKLELLDKNGKRVASPYNGTERTFNLITEPLK